MHTLNYEWIDTKDALNRSCEVLLSAPEWFFDLEFNSIKREICLIQIHCSGRNFLIDPLKRGLDLSPLFSLFEREDVFKIAHSASEDIRLLVANGCRPAGVFDTDTALRLLNHENPSLKNVVQEYLGILMSKRHQRSNWSKRPLSAGQQEYAAKDVYYLSEVYKPIRIRAEQAGILSWVMEEGSFVSDKFSLQMDGEVMGYRRSELSSFVDYRALTERLKQSIVIPLREEMARRYGAHAARFMLSNALVEKAIYTGRLKAPSYRRALFTEISAELGFCFNDILGDGEK
jgi:ribonuclease D